MDHVVLLSEFKLGLCACRVPAIATGTSTTAELGAAMKDLQIGNGGGEGGGGEGGDGGGGGGGGGGMEEDGSMVELVVDLSDGPGGDGDAEKSAVGFCFGAQQGWQQFCVWVLYRSGEVESVCPICPRGSRVTAESVLELMEDAVAELHECEERDGEAQFALQGQLQWLQVRTIKFYNTIKHYKTL